MILAAANGIDFNHSPLKLNRTRNKHCMKDGSFLIDQLSTLSSTHS